MLSRTVTKAKISEQKVAYPEKHLHGEQNITLEAHDNYQHATLPSQCIHSLHNPQFAMLTKTHRRQRGEGKFSPAKCLRCTPARVSTPQVPAASGGYPSALLATPLLPVLAERHNARCASRSAVSSASLLQHDTKRPRLRVKPAAMCRHPATTVVCLSPRWSTNCQGNKQQWNSFLLLFFSSAIPTDFRVCCCFSLSASVFLSSRFLSG